MRKVVQIAPMVVPAFHQMYNGTPNAGHTYPPRELLFALCDDGTIWRCWPDEAPHPKWVQLRTPPGAFEEIPDRRGPSADGSYFGE